MSLYVASYDIGDDRRRLRVARLLSQYGSRLQQSVFELQMEPDELNELQREIGAILGQRDEFVLLPVDERGSRRTLCWQREPARFDPVTFV